MNGIRKTAAAAWDLRFAAASLICMAARSLRPPPRAAGCGLPLKFRRMASGSPSRHLQAHLRCPSFATVRRCHPILPNSTRASVTVIAPPIRVAICAKGISCIRFAAVRMATSPVPP